MKIRWEDDLDGNGDKYCRCELGDCYGVHSENSCADVIAFIDKDLGPIKNKGEIWVGLVKSLVDGSWVEVER